MTGVKDAVEEVNRAGVVYTIDCNDCDLIYIRESGRKVTKLVKEHKAPAQQVRTVSLGRACLGRSRIILDTSRS